jgi:hypothetical protein
MKGIPTITLTIYIILLLSLSTRTSAIPFFDVLNAPEFDYTRTDLLYFYGDHDFVILGNPFDNPRQMGGAVYEIILQYVPRFQEIGSTPLEPAHVLDLTIRDDYGRRRIGQRLFLGESWLSDGKHMANKQPEDYARLTALLHRRYQVADRYETSRITLRSPQSHELPHDWMPGAVSAVAAAKRMASPDDKLSADSALEAPATVEQLSLEPASPEIDSSMDEGAGEADPAISVGKVDRPRVQEGGAFGAEYEFLADKPPSANPTQEVPAEQWAYNWLLFAALGGVLPFLWFLYRRRRR